MANRIAVCVVSLPDRHALLAEAVASVHAQTRQPDDLVVGIDYSMRGEIWNMNRVMAATDAEWVAFLHDDDLHAPDHLATAVPFMADYDVIVSDFALDGRPASTIEPFHEDWADLERTNWFPPSAVVVRREVFGEWSEPEREHDWVDWANWRRLHRAGARFVRTRACTMVYRFGPWSNGSWSS